MQIDFHHAVTYVACRDAGFSHAEADTVAHCAAYVDDATDGKLVRFKNNKSLYKRIATAHKMLDYRNIFELANHYSWLPFHFLPGNGGNPADESNGLTFTQKIVCRPDSHIARDMIASCIREKGRAYALHRLGITLHVYADTWAHQGFTGQVGRENKVDDLRIDAIPKGNKSIISAHLKHHRMHNSILKASDYCSRFKWILRKIKNIIPGLASEITDEFPLGHGAVLSFPDLPYLHWSYKPEGSAKSDQKRIERKNWEVFVTAADHLCKVAKAYQAGSSDIDGQTGLSDDTKTKIETLFQEFVDMDGGKRHNAWLSKIEQGYFSFGPQRLEYTPWGINSWKHVALGTIKEIDLKVEKFVYTDQFLTSDWKMFHDAAQAHRFELIQNILPRYGICAA